MSDKGLLKQVPNLYQSRLQFLRWGKYVLAEVGNKVFLFTLAFLSIIDLLFSYLLITNIETGSRQLTAVLILVTTLIAFAFNRMKRHPDSGFHNLTIFRTWVITCSVVSFLFIVTSSIPMDLSFVIPKVYEFLYIVTITVSINAPSFLFFAVIDTYVQKRIGSKRLSYAEDNIDSVEIQPEIVDKISPGTKVRIALSLGFDSITKRFVGPNAPTKPCPHCLWQIDFNERIEWLGPTALTCRHCGEVIDIVDLLGDE